MHFTWRDGATTLLLAVVGLVYYGFATGTGLLVTDDVRTALLVIGASGLGMCIVGGSSGYLGRNRYSGLMSILGIAALVLFVIGMFTTEAWTVTWLAIVVAVMWGIALVMRVVAAPSHEFIGA